MSLVNFDHSHLNSYHSFHLPDETLSPPRKFLFCFCVFMFCFMTQRRLIRTAFKSMRLSTAVWATYRWLYH